jgi:hypothetical protein
VRLQVDRIAVSGTQRAQLRAQVGDGVAQRVARKRHLLPQ